MVEHSFHTLARRFWAGELGTTGAVLQALLAPAEMLYRGAVVIRNAAFASGLLRSYRADIPVISVGNLTTGGTGKTPFAHYLARLLRERGAHPAIVHGGYAVDEPELHRSWSADIPVIVDADRVRGARTARVVGADVAVLDDGFQHRRLERDLDIILVAVERWTAAYHLLPRGPWREARSAVLRADLIVATRKTATQAQSAEVRRQLEACTKSHIIAAHLEPAGWIQNDVASGPPPGPAVAVAAVAEPELFAESARLTGATIDAVLAFPDHHAYTIEDAQRILRRAHGTPIVTTQKDWIKLRRLLPPDQVWLLTQRVSIEDGADVLLARLERVLSEPVPHRGT